MNKLLKYCQTGGKNNKNDSFFINNDNLIGSKNKKLDRENTVKPIDKLQKDLLHREKQRNDYENRQTYLSEYKTLNPNFKKILDEEYNRKEFKRKIFDPTIKVLDVASDIGSMGNFVPIPQAQAIGKFSNILGAGVDLYQAADALKEGDYENALINALTLTIPYAIENPKLLGSFKRTNKWIDGGNFANKYGRTTYLNVDKRYKGMKPKELLGNRILLGALGTETLYDIKQTGGKGNGIIAEAGEFYKNENGQIQQINPNTVSHDDYILIDEQGNPISKMPYNQGGVAVNGVESVLSASHENRESDDKSYKQADEDIRIKPKEGKEFAKRFNFENIKFNGGSPSKLFDSVLEAKTNKLKKYNNIEYNENSSYGINSSKANGAYIEALPQDEMIYDEIFNYQESKKQEQNQMYAQTGIKINPEKKGTFKAAATRYGMNMDDLAKDAKNNPDKYSGVLRKKANFYRNFAMQQGGKGTLSPYPEMYGSKPVAMVNIKGKLYPASTVDGRTVSMDDVFNKKDSVELKNFKAIKLNKNERIKK